MVDSVGDNGIGTRQNSEANLRLLRARRGTYRLATLVMAIQIGVTLGVPIIGTAIAIWYPDVRPYVAAFSLAIILIDVAVVDHQYKILLKQAARIGEEFDCNVLQLTWNKFVVGEQVEPEEIHAATRVSNNCDNQIRDWYPVCVTDISIYLARIICQRTNLRYDRQLRRTYSRLVCSSAIILFVGMFVFALIEKCSVVDLVIMLTPAIPFLAWAAREYIRQQEAANQCEYLMKEAQKLWDDARTGQCNEEICHRRSRDLQDAIYNRRASSPLILPGLYRLARSRLEEEMNVGAELMIRQLSGKSK